jgi:hypothetical protein
MGLKQRQTYDPFAQSHRPHRMVIEDRLGQELSSRAIAVGSNVRQELDGEAARWAADGWMIERKDGKPFRFAWFFMRKGDERRHVSLLPCGNSIGNTSDLFRKND